jgi:hypothetical protein
MEYPIDKQQRYNTIFQNIPHTKFEREEKNMYPFVQKKVLV